MAILESARRLSESSLWQLQRRYFENAGRDAFSTATVPHYITNNAYLATAYAQLVLGFVIDRRADLDPNEPMYLVELGAGSGRFEYQFLERFTELLATAGLEALRFTYVITDFTDAGFAPIAAHEQFARFFAAGTLDYACFDAVNDRTITLSLSGTTIERGALRNPLVVIGNYFFDGIPIDAFIVRKGEIYEAAASLTCDDAAASLETPAVLPKLKLQYEERAIKNAGRYYDDPAIDAVLERYRTVLQEGAVRFPIAGLRVCRWLQEIANDDWLLISADKGTIDPKQFEGARPAGLSVHGSFSINVNYDAIFAFLEAAGAATFAADHLHESLAIVCAVSQRERHPTPALRAAYAAAIAEFGPDDYFVLRRVIETNVENLTLEALLALLRLGRYEPRQLVTLVTPLRKLLPKATVAQKAALADSIERTAARYFFIGERSDFAFSAGVLLTDLGLYESAIEHFSESQRRYGDDSGTCYNLAFCHLRLGKMAEARQFARRALAVEPSHQGSRRILDNIPLIEEPPSAE